MKSEKRQTEKAGGDQDFAVSDPQKWSRMAGLLVSLVGLFVLIGWVFDIPTLKSVLPQLVTMKANTAVAFLLSGLSLFLYKSEERGAFRIVRQIAALVVALIGLLTLSEYLFGWDLGVDQLLFQEPATAVATFRPGRMAITTAFNFLLLGLSLLMLPVRRGLWMYQPLSLVTLLVSILALLGYSYGVESFYAVSVYTAMAVHTAITFLVLSLGILTANPNRGLGGIFFSKTVGGTVVRRLLPAAVLVPFLTGWLCLLGQEAGFYDERFRLALHALSNILILTLLIWFSARWLHKADQLRRQFEESLLKSEEKSRSIIESASEAFITIDSEGSIQDWNLEAEKTFGWKKEEVIGKNLVQTIIPERYRQRHEEALRRFLETGEGVIVGKRIEMESLHRDGHEVPVELTISALKIGGNYQFNALLHDVSERRKTEEEIAKITRAVEQSATMVMITDVKGNLEYVNSQFCKTTGYEKEEVIGTNPRFLKSGHTPPEEYKKLWGTIVSGRKWWGTMANRKKNGEFYWVHESISPVFNAGGVITHFVSSQEDVTKQKELEEQLEQSNQELQTLLHVSSHDLKEPLRSIETFSSWVNEQYADRLDERGKDFLNRITRGAVRLRSLLDDLLILSRTKRMEKPMGEVEGKLIVQEVLSSLTTLIHETKARVVVAQDLSCFRVDPRWAVQALYNLVLNALKFTHPGEPPDVEIAGYKNGFVVRDRGPGIPSEEAEKMFELFQRGVGREIEGTGAGLAIVRSIAKQHGGDAWVRPREGGGSEFFIVF